VDARNAEVDKLRSQVETLTRRLEDPNLLEWAANKWIRSQEDSIRSVEAAKNKTRTVLVPLETWVDFLVQGKRAASMKLASMMESDEEAVDRAISYLLVVVGAVLALFIVRQTRFDLERFTLSWAMYQSLAWLGMYGASVWQDRNLLAVLLDWSHAIHDASLIVWGAFAMVYWLFVCLVTLRHWMIRNSGTLTVRHIAQVGLVTWVILDFHEGYWSPAMLGVEGRDPPRYAWYAGAMAVLAVCLALGRSRSASSTIATTAKKVDKISDAEEEEDEEAQPPPPPASLPPPGGDDDAPPPTTTTTRKSKKKSKQHHVDLESAGGGGEKKD
jgi:hypothetical protein